MEFQLIPLTVENYKDKVSECGATQLSYEVLLYQEKIRTEETLLKRIGAVTDHGELIGFGLAVSGPWDPITKPGHFLLQIKVDPQWCRRGIGNKIYQELLRYVTAHEAIVLETNVGDNNYEDLAWAEKRGFVIARNVFASKLNLYQLDMSRLIESVGNKETEGFRFVSLADYSMNDGMVDRLLHFHYELMKDVPSIGEVDSTELMKLKKIITESDGWEPSGVKIAIYNDCWVAMAWVIRRPDGNYYSYMTGVLREYRGQGLGLAVKIKSIEYAQEQNAEFVFTHNDSSNTAMLAINKGLGFQSEHGIYCLVQTMRQANEKR
ncbi:GNAT family N-acetyltransferase [Paenibacillus eucommiae]|uniref:Ribosomal protein S18 acetylase RimI-like enzyme n=1 Tax=Paenibacillus eucommiae TaxID=1355755 RepID=A0ABS4IZM2_9BACL|nr:GNAT family N-acetyltransferase [Paenibacillus eucommiae]MBP1993032.1 ribosomal protein S18 acetylase RimI-like enzyme [Paenibacillus eucommiae]